MDPGVPHPQQQQPQLPYFYDPGLEALFGFSDTLSDTRAEDQSPIFDWNALEYSPSGIPDGGTINGLVTDTSQLSGEPSNLDPSHESLQNPDLPSYSNMDFTYAQDLELTQKGYTNLQQWLEGTYRPPAPCTYCRRHRLQCLTIRTTSANPNPVTSCSTCVALFRECSLSKGEKRQPSGFETLSPVMGHLHGVTEHPEDGVSDNCIIYRAL